MDQQQPDQRTTSQLREELRIIELFLDSDGHKQYQHEIVQQRGAIQQTVFDIAPQHLGDILNREQDIGRGQLLDSLKDFFLDWHQAIKEQLQNKTVTRE